MLLVVEAMNQRAKIQNKIMRDNFSSSYLRYFLLTKQISSLFRSKSPFPERQNTLARVGMNPSD